MTSAMIFAIKSIVTPLCEVPPDGIPADPKLLRPFVLGHNA